MARSTFPSQNVQSTPCSDHFWRFRCRKSRRRCGAKHISKSKCTAPFSEARMLKNARRCGAKHVSKSKYTKHLLFAPLSGVQMSKKCTPLWRKAHFEVKMLKMQRVRTTFKIQMSLRLASLHYTTLPFTTLHSTTPHYITNTTSTTLH